MSSGFTRLYRRLKVLWTGHAGRVGQLVERDKTVPLDEVQADPPHEIVAVDFGYGIEFWTIQSTPIRIESGADAIRDGRLILEGQNQVARESSIVRSGLSFRELHLRF